MKCSVSGLSTSGFKASIRLWYIRARSRVQQRVLGRNCVVINECKGSAAAWWRRRRTGRTGRCRGGGGGRTVEVSCRGRAGAFTRSWSVLSTRVGMTTGSSKSKSRGYLVSWNEFGWGHVNEEDPQSSACRQRLKGWSSVARNELAIERSRRERLPGRHQNEGGVSHSKDGEISFFYQGSIRGRNPVSQIIFTA